MKKVLLYSAGFLFLVSSCRKLDNHPPLSANQPAILDSAILVDHLDIPLQVKTDSVSNFILNIVNLPFQTSLLQTRLWLYTSNTSKVEVVQVNSNGISNICTYQPNEVTHIVNFVVDYYQPVTIKLYNGSLVSMYVLKLSENQLPDPVFTNLSFQLNPNNNTPLAGILQVTSTERVSVTYIVKGQDGEDFISQSPLSNCKINGFSQMNLFGLYPNMTNLVKVVITNNEGSMASKDLYITTDVLPAAFPDSSDIVVKTLDANAKTNFILYYPYQTINAQPFNSPGDMAYPIVLDKHGKVRWYMSTPFVLDMKPMPNGHFLQCFYGALFREVDLLGNVYKQITPPTICHHDFQLLPNGNILYTADDPSINGTTEDLIYEIDYQTGALVKKINLYNILDPTRPQQPFIATSPTDWFHNNSLTYDSIDNSIIITGRHQSTICKIDYATNKLKWIISDPTYWKQPWSDYLLQPTGSDFEYTWGQHCVVLNPADHNKLIVFDNGNGRSYTPLKPQNSYSRLAEFTVDQNAKTVAQTFDFGKSYGSENYSPALGSVDYINEDLFVCFPLINKDANGVANDFTGTPSIRFMEMDRNRNVLLDISIKNKTNPANGYRTYRGHPFNFSL